MKLPYNLFVVCFFCLTSLLANGIAHATEQVNDSFDCKGKKYSITGEKIPLDFSKWGLRPVSSSTACWRGYVASFALDGGKLVLTDLKVFIVNNGDKDTTAPKINGVAPKKDTRVERLGGTVSGHLEYENVNLPLDYTGTAILKDGVIMRGMHGRFDDAAGYETAIELTFEKGILKSEKDLSQAMAEIRKTTEHIWAMSENVEVIKDLISEGLDVNMESYNGTTPLHVAIEKENLSMVEFLLSKGANVHVKHWRSSSTLLHVAAGKENIDIVKLLVSLGLDVNAKDIGGLTPLHAAARNPNVAITEFLLVQGADVNAKCNNPYPTPIYWAVAVNSNVKVVELLVSKGADMSAKDDLLQVATQNKNVAITEFLVAQGASINAKTEGDSTPLHTAARRGNVGVAEFLVAKGADVNAKDKQGQTPLHFVALSSYFAGGSNMDDAAAKFLVEQGADINAKDNEGNTPLHLAVRSRYGNNDIVKFFVSHGADVRAKNRQGETPLDVAKKSQSEAGLRYLSNP
ncbi:MAG: ankyrin repeat domain-containing protein [Planctomycetaceae bacterium]|nr:ankyrin repeat domain-containing protein [Planctomycetaceae bacterium]